MAERKVGPGSFMARDLICSLSQEGRFTSANPAALSHLSTINNILELMDSGVVKQHDVPVAVTGV